MTSTSEVNDPRQWLAELPTYQRSLIDDLLVEGDSYETAARYWLESGGTPTNAPFGGMKAGPGLFDNLKTEINKLVCGDPKYDELRAQTSETWDKYKPGVLMAVAAGLGAVIGVAAVVIVPVVALLLAAVGTVGVNTWCATFYRVAEPPGAS